MHFYAVQRVIVSLIEATENYLDGFLLKYSIELWVFTNLPQIILQYIGQDK